MRGKILACVGVVGSLVLWSAGRAPAAEPGGAEAYRKWLLGCLGAIEQDLPAITQSAEAAARLYVEQDYGIQTIGDPGLVSEATDRAGGLMQMARAKTRRIILCFPRERDIAKDIADAAVQVKGGSFVVYFGRTSFIDAARRTGLEASAFVDTHAAENGGLINGDGGNWVVPTDAVAQMAALWTWTGEFVAACTRLDKMPTMYQAYHVGPAAMERAKKLQGLRFHLEAPRKVEAGKLGKDYLAEVTRYLTAVSMQQLDSIRRVAALAAKAKADGRGVYCVVTGHAIRDHVEVPHNPGVFELAGRAGDWNGSLKKSLMDGNEVKVNRGDLFYFVGFDSTFGPAEALRKAGATVAWSFALFKNDNPSPDKPRDVAEGEVCVDQGWALGDAVVTVPGYDVKILPTSGILAEATLWMAAAEVIRPGKE